MPERAKVKVYGEWPFDAAEAKRRQRETAEVLAVRIKKKVDLGGGITMDFVLLPAGEFLMGSKNGNDDEQPVHRVRVTQAFYMGVTPVTQAQYAAVLGGKPWTKEKKTGFLGLGRAKIVPRENIWDSSDAPATYVSWHDASRFCLELSAMARWDFELPTEAQWEYACRAGSAAEYCFGDSEAELGQYAWHGHNSGETTHPVGEKKPNNWEIYDMHGNVLEWCRDWYDGSYYENGEMADPCGPARGSTRVLRGGSWGYYPSQLRSASRFNIDPPHASHNDGFRVVIS